MERQVQTFVETIYQDGSRVKTVVSSFQTMAHVSRERGNKMQSQTEPGHPQTWQV